MIFILHYFIGMSLFFMFSVIYNSKCEIGRELSPAQIIFASTFWPIFTLAILGGLLCKGIENLIDLIKIKK